MPTETVELGEDEFWERYKPMDAPDGGTVFTLEEARSILKMRWRDDNFLWTLSDGDDGWGVYCTPGVHMGGFGFCVTERPWEHENICGTWLDATEHKEVEK